MEIDFTVRLGDILTMLGLFGGGIVVVGYMRSDLRVLGQRVGSIENQLIDLKKIIVQQARHDERITKLEEALRLLAHR